MGGGIGGPPMGVLRSAALRRQVWRPKSSSRLIKLFDLTHVHQGVPARCRPDLGEARRRADRRRCARNFDAAPLASEIGFGTVYTTPAKHGPFFSPVR